MGSYETKIDYVFKQIGEIVKNYGKIKESTIKRFTIFFAFSYNKEARNIKVEISKRNFDSKYVLKNYFGIPMLVMIRKDMFAHKLVAMYERIGRSNRDIYDVWFFLKKMWPINKDLVEARMKIPFKEFLKNCIEVLGKVDNRHILSGIGELLNGKQKDWVKQNLVKDVVFLLRVLLDSGLH